MDVDNLLEQYTTIIGGGGYGLVKAAEQDTGIAVKFIYKSECWGARAEFVRNKQIYDACKIVENCLHKDVRCGAVKPIDYFEHEFKDYSCEIFMERLYFDLEYAIHPCFTDAIPLSMINGIVYKTGTNIPRGYFFDADHISRFMTPEKITFRMGLIDGACIFGAKLVPEDMEYVITSDKRLIAIDFGMVKDLALEKHNVNQIADRISQLQEFSNYYHPKFNMLPETLKNTCADAYIFGFTQSYICFNYNNKLYEELYEALLKLYR